MKRLLASMFQRETSATLAFRRLVYVTTKDHPDTFADWLPVLALRGISVTMETWEQLLIARRVPRATYVLTDFDRLATSELEAAAKIYDLLRAHGARVYNDPRKFRPRAHLIKYLFHSGINSYTCHLPSTGEWPTRFPVFLRTMAAHRGVLGELLHDDAACRQALDEALQQGIPISDLAFVEFAASPTPPKGLFQKLSAFRVGEHVVRANTVNDSHWMAKIGVQGIASDEQYRQELKEMKDYPLRDFVRQVFDTAGVEFGRLDFGFSKGRHEIYEINTNPYMSVSHRHPNADRAESLRVMNEQLAAAFDASTPTLKEGWIQLHPPLDPFIRP